MKKKQKEIEKKSLFCGIHVLAINCLLEYCVILLSKALVFQSEKCLKEKKTLLFHISVWFVRCSFRVV